MNRRTFLTTSALCLGYAGTRGLASTARAPRTFSSAYDNVLGTSLELDVTSESPEAARLAESRVLAEIARQSGLLSAWDSSSEFSRWARTSGQPVRVSSDLFDVLSLFDTWRARTDGAVDAGVDTLTRVWRDGAARGQVPTSRALGDAVARLQQPQWRLDPIARTATRVGTAPLVLSSFTKSYVIDKAARAAIDVPGISAVVVNIGGDVAVRGDVTQPVAIADPWSAADNAPAVSHVVVANGAVATSGNYHRGFDIGGVRYSHVIDPRTGATADDVISATVVARQPTDAGALATAFSVLTPAESRALALSIPGVEFLLIGRDGERSTSRGWPALETSARRMAGVVAPAATQAAGAGMWDPSMELTISFETPLMGGPAKRPFVAAWIEDADRFPVKTLALWYHEDRYLTEMKAWYRADRLRSMSEGRSIVRTVGSATRPPGKYTLKWDGRDNDGKPVPTGKYTVYLEVSREHGGYQLLRQEMTFAAAPQTVSFKPGPEIAAASFDYHKLAR